MLRSFSLLGLLSLVVLVVACAGRARRDVKYPPRGPRCGLQIFYAEVPAVPAWDDIGQLEVICYMDDSEATCFNKARVEACRMGGNIIYRLPRKVWRPREEVLGYRGMVAHTRPVAGKTGAGETAAGEPMPPPATPEEAAGPVVPLTGPGAPSSEGTADGGAEAARQTP